MQEDKTTNILLVEDNSTDVFLMEEVLNDLAINYEMSIARDGQEAIEKLQQARDTLEKSLPDVIFLDLNMPRMNGHEVLAVIREDPDLAPIPVVVLTVSQDQEDILKALDLKMNHYIRKPVTQSNVRAILQVIEELWAE